MLYAYDDRHKGQGHEKTLKSRKARRGTRTTRFFVQDKQATTIHAQFVMSLASKMLSTDLDCYGKKMFLI